MIDINSILDIVKSIEDIKYLESKGFDVTELLDHFTGKTKRKKCAECEEGWLDYDREQRCGDSSDGLGAHKNRHGACKSFSARIEEVMK